MSASERPTAARVAFWASLVAIIVPLWWFHFPPAVDLPAHAAIVSVLERLLTGDPAIAAHYALNLQLAPYHLFYVLAVGLSLVSTPLVATKILLSLAALVFLKGAQRLQGGAPSRAPALLVVALLFFNISFFYGFVVMFLGVPLVVYGAAALSDLGEKSSRRAVIEATLSGLGATSAHILIAPAWGIVVAAALVAALPGRRRAVLVVGLTGLFPVIPALVSSLFTRAGLGPSFEYPTLHGFIYYAGRQLTLFDQGPGAAGLVTGLALVIGLALFELWGSSRPRTALDTLWLRLADHARQRRFALTFFGLSLAAYALLPLQIVTPDGPVWGLSLRYSVFVGLGLVLFWPSELTARLARVAGVAAAVAFVVYFAGLYVFWARFDAATAPFDTVLAAMAPNRTLATAVSQERFLAAWPPVRLHTHAYYLAQGGAYDDRVFAGGHLPIRALAEPAHGCDLEATLCLGEFDYLLVQDDGEAHRAQEPADGELVAHAGDWRLYARRTPGSGGEAPGR